MGVTFLSHGHPREWTFLGSGSRSPSAYGSGRNRPSFNFYYIT